MLTLDPQIAELYAAMAEQMKAMGPISMPTRGDALALRALCDPAMERLPAPSSEGVSVRAFRIPTSDGESIDVNWYTPGTAANPGAAAVYMHGGGMIAGRPQFYDGLVRHYVQESQAAFAVPAYRLAPEHTGTRLAEDGLDTLQWLREHANELGVDPTRIAVMGDSGGGGVAAGTAILARNNDISLALQVLIYPMLDDRNTVPDPALAPFVSWDWDANFTGWNAVLGEDLGGEHVSPAAAPARLSDFRDLAPAYIEVGELDIFRDESISYAQRLHGSGISCELHVLPGVPHGHDRLSIDIDVSRRTIADRCRVLAKL